jgi:hypothetical protein
MKTMSLSEHLLCDPTLIGAQIRLIPDETTDAANTEDLFVGSSP